MSETYTDSNGQLHILRGGSWRPTTPAEAEVLGENPVEQFGKAFGQSVKGTAGLLQAGLAAVFENAQAPSMGLRRPLAGGPRTRIFDAGVERMQQAGAALQERETLAPGPTEAGELLELFADPALAGSAALAASKATIKGMARKVAGRGAADIRVDYAQRAIMDGLQDAPPIQSSAAVTPEMGRVIGTVAKNLGGGTSVGSAEVLGGLWEGLKRMPVLRGALESLENFALKGARLSTDQMEMIPVLDRLGYEFLPGQRQGNDVIGEMIKSEPFMRDALNPTLSNNARQLETRALRAAGLQDDKFSRGSLRLAEDELGSRFNRVAESIGEINLPDELRVALDDPDIMTPRDARLFGLGDEGAKTLVGRDAMELRSKLNSALAAANSDTALGVRSRRILESLDQLDDIIKTSIDSPDTVKLWNDTQQRWRIVMALNKKGVVTDTGELSIKRFNTGLETMFQSEYRKQLRAPRGPGSNLPDDIADLMDYVRGARMFESNLGDSGTATRLALGQMIRNPLSFGAQRLGADFIQKNMLRVSNQALDLIDDAALILDDVPIP